MKQIMTLAAIAMTFTAYPAFTPPAMAQQNCPPGLAKKNPPCVPPGQARQGVTAEEWRNRHAIGDRVRDDDYVYLEDYDPNRWNRLPPLDSDEAYAVYDGGVIVLSRTSLQILRLIDLLAN